MELYNEANVEADLNRITAEIAPHYTKRLEAGDIKWFEINSGHQNMNLFWATVEYLPTKDGERFGPIKAHYTILIRDGRIEFQNGL